MFYFSVYPFKNCSFYNFLPTNTLHFRSTFVNPFESDEESHRNEPSTSFKPKKNIHSKPKIKAAKGKSKKVAAASTPSVKNLFGSESDSETDTSPKGPRKLKRIRMADSSVSLVNVNKKNISLIFFLEL